MPGGHHRFVCATCGAPVAFESEKWSHEIHFGAALLDNPSIFRPTEHVNWSEHLPWDIPGMGWQ